MKCKPGFRAIRSEPSWSAPMVEFKIVYVNEDQTVRHHSYVFVDQEHADEFAQLFGSCECHGTSHSPRTR